MVGRSERESILRGIRGAKRLQRDLRLDVGASRAQRVDVFGCIARSGAMLMFQPLEPLLGAFIREEGVAGIILSTRRPLGMQRFTAAHELGHLVLGHDPHADDEGILRRAPWASDVARAPRVPPEEREADAFASYFLLPPYLIKEQMELRGWEPRHFAHPEIVYQASLRFGTSYRATVFALEREHVIGRSLGQQLRGAEPRDLKRQLLGDYALKDAQRVDVWHLTERDEGAVIEASRDDLFLLRLKEDSGGGYVWTFDELRDAGFAILRDGREPVPEGQIGAPTVRRVLAHAERPLGGQLTLREIRPWAPDDDPQLLTLYCKTATSDEAGLFEPQREELLAAS